MLKPFLAVLFTLNIAFAANANPLRQSSGYQELQQAIARDDAAKVAYLLREEPVSYTHPDFKRRNTFNVGGY